MSAFLTDLDVDERGDNDAVLLSPLVYQSDRLGRIITAPAGFETDYASVPRLPFAYMLFGGVAKKAATLHDYLYRTGLVSRADADATFREAMLVSDVSGWRAWAMYGGVRAFGWEFYDPNHLEGQNEDHPAS